MTLTSSALDRIVDAVLYEGYILYPYRPSSKKNRRERFTFGRVYPKDYSEAQRGAEPFFNQTECLLQYGDTAPTVEVTVRFLHPLWREVGFLSSHGPEITGGAEASFQVVPELLIGGVLHQTWQEATEREVVVSVEPSRSTRVDSQFSFPASRTFEPFPYEPGVARAAMVRRQEALAGTVEVEAAAVGPNLVKLTVRVLNRTPMDAARCDDQDAVIMQTFASTHTILKATGGKFISLLDPPAEFATAAAECKNIGTYPVLVGDESQSERDTMLSSPIILYDYPQIAPESAGGFCDGTEIDEMLTLRVLTMTDSEKLEMRQVDDFARRILERTEAAGPRDLLKLHGAMREVKNVEEFFNPPKRLEHVAVDGRELRAGASVRIRPKKRADAMDMMLAGKVGIIEAIEEDAEGGIHLALVLEDDPGRDLGMARQPGHRFFYMIEEVEPLQEASA